MTERAYEYHRLPQAAQQDIARLEIELYDAKGALFQAGAAFLVAGGVLCVLFGYVSHVGAFTYTGGDEIYGIGLLSIVVGVVHYVRSDRANRLSVN